MRDEENSFTTFSNARHKYFDVEHFGSLNGKLIWFSYGDFKTSNPMGKKKDYCVGM
jgi:hypothetical protein